MGKRINQEEDKSDSRPCQIPPIFGIAAEAWVVVILPGITAVMVGIPVVKKGEHEMALGNVIGSNMFNTLAVVGIAGTIQPMSVEPVFLYRDVLIMVASTVALFIFCIGIRGQGRLNRFEGGAFVLAYIAYTWYLVQSAFI